MGRHRLEARRTAANAISEARLGEAADDMAASWNDPKTTARSLAIISAEAESLGLREGCTPEILKSKIEEARTVGFQRRIEAALVQDPAAAQKIYEDNKTLIDGRQRAAIEQKLEAGVLRQQSQQATAEIKLAHPGDLAAQIEAAKRIANPKVQDETIARLRYPFGNEMLTEPQILDKLSNKDAAIRKEAAKSFGKVQGDNIAVFSLVTNTLIKDKEIDDRWRKYARPQSFRNLANVVEDEVVDALAASVKAAYPKLSHRYYKLKARWFGVETMPYWDRNAPLPDAAENANATGNPAASGFQWTDLAVFLFFAVPIGGRLLAGLLGRKFGSLATGAAVGMVAWFFTMMDWSAMAGT